MIHVCSLNHLHATVASTGAGRIVSLLTAGTPVDATVAWRWLSEQTWIIRLRPQAIPGQQHGSPRITQQQGLGVGPRIKQTVIRSSANAHPGKPVMPSKRPEYPFAGRPLLCQPDRACSSRCQAGASPGRPNLSRGHRRRTGAPGYPGAEPVEQGGRGIKFNRPKQAGAADHSNAINSNSRSTGPLGRSVGRAWRLAKRSASAMSPSSSPGPTPPMAPAWRQASPPAARPRSQSPGARRPGRKICRTTNHHDRGRADVGSQALPGRLNTHKGLVDDQQPIPPRQPVGQGERRIGGNRPAVGMVGIDDHREVGLASVAGSCASATSWPASAQRGDARHRSGRECAPGPAAPGRR